MEAQEMLKIKDPTNKTLKKRLITTPFVLSPMNKFLEQMKIFKLLFTRNSHDPLRSFQKYITKT